MKIYNIYRANVLVTIYMTIGWYWTFVLLGIYMSNVLEKSNMLNKN